jgi:hypothetical protein
VVESLVALSLPEAMAAAEAEGVQVVRVVVTGPPGAGKGQGVPRVVRERQVADGLELTIAFPRHAGRAVARPSAPERPAPAPGAPKTDVHGQGLEGNARAGG